jgi:hypothetical protein
VRSPATAPCLRALSAKRQDAARVPATAPAPGTAPSTPVPSASRGAAAERRPCAARSVSAECARNVAARARTPSPGVDAERGSASGRAGNRAITAGSLPAPCAAPPACEWERVSGGGGGGGGGGRGIEGKIERGNPNSLPRGEMLLRALTCLNVSGIDRSK